jgi:tape measure domain-containing protein
MQLGDISVDVILNKQSLNSAITELEQRARNINLLLAPTLNPTAVQTLNTQLNQLEQRARGINLFLEPKVNDKALTDLNKHLDKKLAHFKAVNRAFKFDPINPVVDFRDLELLERKIDRLTKFQQARVFKQSLAVTPDTPSPNKQFPVSLDNIDTQNRRVIYRERYSANERTGYKSEVKEIVVGLQKVERAVYKSREQNLVGSIFKGFTEKIGADINKQLVSGVRDVFGKDAATGFRQSSRQASKFVKSVFVDSDDFQKATQNIQNTFNERLKKGVYRLGDGIVAALDNREGDFTARINSFTASVSKDVDFLSVFAEVKNELKEAGKELKKGILSENNLKQITTPVGSKLSAYREMTLQERALPLVRERALEILQSKKVKNTANSIKEDTNELIIATGGYAGARGKSGYRLANALNKEKVDGRQALWIQNDDTDLPKEAMSDAQKKLIALLTSLGKPNLRGYSTDAVEMAAQAYAAKERNPNINIKLLGESGGGFVAEEASKILDMLGVKNSFLGVGTPRFIGGLDKDDRKIISPDETLGAETAGLYAGIGLAERTPSQQILGVKGHPYENYQTAKVAELQNFLEGSPGKATPELMTNFKQSLAAFKKQDKTKLSSAELEKQAEFAYGNLQYIRRFMLVETGDTKKELEQIASEFESVFVSLSPEGREFNDARKNLSKAQEYLKYLRLQPGVEAGLVANKISKELEQLKKELKGTFGKAVGTPQAKYQALLKDIEKTQGQLLDPTIGIKPQTNAKADAFKKYQNITNRTGISRQLTPDLSPLIAAKSKTESENLRKQQFTEALNETAEITKRFQEAFQDIKNNLASKKAPEAQTTAKFVLENLPRARADIKAKRDELGIGNIGSSDASRVNQLLGQLAGIEKKIKQQFAKAKITLPEIDIKSIEQAGLNIPQGLKKGIDAGTKLAAEAGEKLAEETIQATEQKFEIKSPSKVFERIGKFVSAGLKKGIKSETFSDVFNALSSVAVLKVGIDLFRQYGAVVLDVATNFERTGIKLQFALGNVGEATDKFRELREESKRLGTNLIDTVDGYSSLAASTKDTSLEGAATDRIFKGFSEAGVVQQLTREQQQGLNLAVQQIAGKGVVQQEELRGQIGERLLGSQNIAARSRGQTVQELNRDIRRGTVTSEEFLPQFAAQLSAESALTLPKALESSTAIVNRFDSAVLDLQATLGKPLLDVRNLGLAQATSAIEMLSTAMPFLANGLAILGFDFLLTATKTATFTKASTFLGVGLNFLKNRFELLTPLIGKFALKFVLLTTAIEVVQALGRAFSDASGDLKGFAESLEAGLDAYKKLKNESTDKTPLFREATSGLATSQRGILESDTGERRLKDSAIGNGLLGFLPNSINKDSGFLQKAGFYTRAAVQNVERKNFGDYDAKTFDDRFKAISRIVNNNVSTNTEISNLLSTQNNPVSQANNIDKQLRDLQLKRRGLNFTKPEASTELRDIQKQEAELLKRREATLKPVSALQGQNAATIETLKSAIKEYERLAGIPSTYQDTYRKQADALQNSLRNAENAQQALNKAIKQGLDVYRLFGSRANKILDDFTDTSTSIGFSANNAKGRIAQGQIENMFSPEQAGLLNTQIDQQANIQTLTKLNASIAELSQLVSERSDVLAAYGLSENSGVAELTRKKDSIENPNDQLVVEKVIELQNLKKQANELTGQVNQQSASLVQSLRDAAKAVTDFYRDLQNQSAQLVLETKQIQNTVALNNAKIKLKTALKGQQDTFVTAYVDGLISVIETLNKPLQEGIDAQQKLLQAAQQAQGQQLQANQLGRQNPVGLSGDLNSVGSAGSGVGSGFVSPIKGQSLEKLIAYKPSFGQGFFGVRDGGRRRHSKVDFDSRVGAGQGAEVLASISGTASFRKISSNSGGVDIAGKDSKGRNITVVYNHLALAELQKFFGGNKTRQVNAGERMSTVTMDSLSTGAHLDFGIKVNGQYVEPQKWLATEGMALTRMQKSFNQTQGNNRQSENMFSASTGSGKVNAQSIAKKNGLQSLLVTDLRGNILGSHNANQSPASPASTIKLIIGDLATRNLANTNSVAIKSGQIAEGDSRRYSAGQTFTPKELITRMLKDSDNTATNALIGALGGVSKTDSLAKQSGYTGTTVGSMLSIPGATGFKNKSTAVDTTKAFINLFNNESVLGKTAESALRKTRNFGFKGEAGGKIGNNSRVIGDVGLVNISGQEYVVTSYANVNGNVDKNRGIIRNATNDVSSALGSRGSSQSSATPGLRQNTRTQAQSQGRLPRKAQVLADLLKEPEVQAFLKAVAVAEVGQKLVESGGGYGKSIGGNYNKDDFADPSKLTKIPPNPRGGKQTAFGRYQIHNIDLRAHKEMFGQEIPNLSPYNQDLIGVGRLKYRDAITPLLNGNIPEAIKRAGNEFASLEGSKFNGDGLNKTTGGGRRSTFIANYNRYLADFKAGRGRSGSANVVQTSGDSGQMASQATFSQNPAISGELQQANALIIQNYNQQAENIKAQLASANKLSALEAELQKTKVSNQFEQGLQDSENNTRNAQRRLNDLGADTGFDTPEKQRNRQIIQTEREFNDFTRDIVKQMKELESSKNQLEATRGVIKQGGFQGAEQLQQNLPEIDNGIARLDDALTQTRAIFGKINDTRLAKLKDIDVKFKIDEQKRLQEFNRESLSNRVQSLRKQADAIDAANQGNVGDLSKGDSLKLRKEASELEILGGLEDEIAKLEDLERQGQRTSEQTRKLREQLEGLASQSLDANNLEFERNLSERLLKIDERGLALKEKDVNYESEKADLLAKRAELFQAQKPFDFTLGNPLEIRRNSQIETTNLQSAQSILAAKRFALEQKLSKEETDKLIAGINELNGLKLDNLRREFNNLADEQANAVLKNRRTIDNKLEDSTLGIMGGVAEYYNSTSRSGRADEINKQIAVRRNELDLSNQKAELQEFAKATNLSEAELQVLMEDLTRLNSIQLTNINNQFDPFLKVANAGFSSLSESISGLIQGTSTWGDLFTNITSSIGKSLADLAAQFITNGIADMFMGKKSVSTPGFGKESSGFLGALFGGDDSGLGLIGSIFGFADGGKVTGINQNLRHLDNPIGEALRKEGNNSVLAALTPGERVLNLTETAMFERMYPRGIQKPVMNFNNGGKVQGSMSGVANFKPSSTQINIPVTVSGSDLNGTNAKQLSESLRAVVVAELGRQQQPGGVLNR